MKHCKVIFLTLILFSQLTLAQESQALAQQIQEIKKARYYRFDKTNEEPLFTQETQVEKSQENKTVLKSKITDKSGTVIMTEKAEVSDDKIISQSIEQLQTNELYELSVENKKAKFKTYFIKEGKKADLHKSAEFEIKDNFVTGPTAEKYLQNRWQALQNSEIILVDFGIFELMKIVEFQFQKISEDERKLTVKMKPSHFFISLFVDPILLEFDKNTKKILRFKGRTPVGEVIDKKWKALDLEILY